jgi:hypothetical protein
VETRLFLSLVLSFASLASAVSCRSSDAKRAVPPSATADGLCPSDVSLAELHAAAFWMEHDGGDARVRSTIEAARAATNAGPSCATSAKAFRLIDELEGVRARRAAGDAAWVARAEAVRGELSAWPCLRDDLHSRLHRDLPPIGR